MLATATLESSSIKFSIEPGNEDLAASSPEIDGSEVDGSEADEEISASVLTIGDSIETDYVTLTLESSDCAEELYDGAGQWSISSQDGNPYIYIKGTMTNNGSEPIDTDNIYLQFTFDDTYSYEGDVSAYYNGSSGFIDDLSPLTGCGYYIYAAVPQSVLDSYEVCSVKVGFTENFDNKYVLTGGLPDFDHCDDIFTIEINQ